MSYKSIAEWRELLRSGALAAVADPVLLYAEAESVPKSTYETLGSQSARNFRKPSAAPLDELRVVVVAKRPKAAFPDQIGIGRTHTVDIVLPFALVSKFHAYITRTADGYMLFDSESKNGTHAHGQRLAPGASVLLGASATVQFGSLVMVFMTAETFTRLLNDDISLPPGC